MYFGGFINFYSPWNNNKIYAFLMILGGTEVNWLALNIRSKFWTWSYRASSNGIKWRLRFTGFTARKMSKYGVFSGSYFPIFSPNKGKYGPEKNSVFGHFLRSVCLIPRFADSWIWSVWILMRIMQLSKGNALYIPQWFLVWL